jgi:hypothetical protein
MAVRVPLHLRADIPGNTNPPLAALQEEDQGNRDDTLPRTI